MLPRSRGGDNKQGLRSGVHRHGGKSLRCVILTKSGVVLRREGGHRPVGPGRVNSVQSAIKCLEGSVPCDLIY